MGNWERVCIGHAWDWGTILGGRQQEHRPEFRGKLRTSPATGLPERYHSPWVRVGAYCLSVVVTTFMLLVAFFVMLCSLNLQGYMNEHVTILERAFYFPTFASYALPGA